MNEHGVEHEKPIDDVFCRTDEEGSRFGAGCVGSNAFVGRRGVEETLKMSDAEGNSIGYACSEPVSRFDVDSFLKVRIEQGPIL